MNRSATFGRVIRLGLVLLGSARFAAAAPVDDAGRDFFEAKIRPVLVSQCYECHNSAEAAEGGLAVDHRAALLKGGESGAVVVPGKPAESRLLAILRHEVEGMEMPQGGAKLSDAVIADFAKWIELGAPDPRDGPPDAGELVKATSWEAVFEKRKQWWSFQPIRPYEPPAVRNADWSEHPVDRFILASLESAGLEPNGPADAVTLVRRLYFTLIGLPPTADEAARWTERLQQPGGTAELVDHLLASPHFGERWARHWMDWVRYADSHGSEGDPVIDNGSLYRDYLVRALNADVPFEQLVREHVAGDLLEEPRLNETLGLNESIIGPAHWRMVFHGFAPTDALDEKVRFTDDALNTFSKAFLGLTVSCARCHDHKFDPISQRDYYALFGVLGSTQPGRNVIDAPEVLQKNRDELMSLKRQIRDAIGGDWERAAPSLAERIEAHVAKLEAKNAPPWLRPLVEARAATDPEDVKGIWRQRFANHTEASGDAASLRQWNLADPAAYAEWFPAGHGLPKRPAKAGEFAVAATGDAALTGIYPAGVYSHAVSAKDPARLSSGKVRLDGEYTVWLRVIGDGGAAARYVVEDYPRNGTVFPVKTLAPEWRWEPFDLTYWNGDEIHLELAAGKDAPLLVNNSDRSWFGLREARIVPKGSPAPSNDDHEAYAAIRDAAGETPPTTAAELAARYAQAINRAVEAWQQDAATDAQAALLDAALRAGLLPNRAGDLPDAAPLLAEYRRLEGEMIVPTRVPGLEETVGRNQRLMVRGNHKQLGDEVPRRFLSAIDATPYPDGNSGRRRLAEDLLRDDNPLTRRVIVNRLWSHLFGRGLVATPDNFGRLGAEPTHPELLDYLAVRFKERGGSLKETIRFLVLSKTWQLDSRPSPSALARDPDNRLLSHAFVRRLEAEAIRDALLVTSGSLEREPAGGLADGGSNRRSLYVRVIRNNLDPFLRTFDFPEPFATVGRRDVTNVPAQSLTMMNDKRVAALARRWAGRVLADKDLPDDESRVRQMFLAAFARPARPDEVSRLRGYLVESDRTQAALVAQVTEIRTQIAAEQAGLRTILDPVRATLLERAGQPSAAAVAAAPRPIARWEFEGDLRDSIGSLHGQAVGGARLDQGAVVVGPDGYVVTPPLDRTIKAKTLEAWVRLDNLDQQGGGVLTIQATRGGPFDAIVYGERSPREWMSGSNFFQRTQPFRGTAEQEAATRPVHVALAYHDDGHIAAYRDGVPYGTPYQTAGPVEFAAGESVLTFGLRHLPAGGNRHLAGRLLRAQLYDRALSDAEVHASSQAVPYFVTDEAIREALTPGARDEVDRRRASIRRLEAEIEALGPVPESVTEVNRWADVAQALFTFQEFIYLR